MKTLLDGYFAPATKAWGFLEAPLDDVVGSFAQWVERLGHFQACDHLQMDLPEALMQLEPLNMDRTLFLSTSSSWTAVFTGDGSGPHSPIGYLSKTHPCRGLFVACDEDKRDPVAGRISWGSTRFVTYAAGHDSCSCERSIVAAHENGRWLFSQYGPPYSFERVDQYSVRRVRDRFTTEMLCEYCSAMGIQLFNPGFYGPKGVLFRSIRPLAADFTPLTFDMVRRKISRSSSGHAP